MADLVTIHPIRKRPKVEVETYAGKVLRPEDLEDVPINTEDYGSILLDFDSGAHGSLTVNQCAAGRKNRLYVEIDGSKLRTCLGSRAAKRAVGRPPRRSKRSRPQRPQLIASGRPRVRPLSGRPQ